MIFTYIDYFVNNLEISTITITIAAKPKAIIMCTKSNDTRLKISLRNGIYIIDDCKISPTPKAIQRYLLSNTDLFRIDLFDLILNACSSWDTDNVTKAIDWPTSWE